MQAYARQRGGSGTPKCSRNGTQSHLGPPPGGTFAHFSPKLLIFTECYYTQAFLAFWHAPGRHFGTFSASKAHPELFKRRCLQKPSEKVPPRSENVAPRLPNGAQLEPKVLQKTSKMKPRGSKGLGGYPLGAFRHPPPGKVTHFHQKVDFFVQLCCSFQARQ